MGAFGVMQPVCGWCSGFRSKETMPALSTSIRLPSANALEDIAPVKVLGRAEIGTATAWASHDYVEVSIWIDRTMSVPEIRGVPRARWYMRRRRRSGAPGGTENGSVALVMAGLERLGEVARTAPDFASTICH